MLDSRMLDIPGVENLKESVLPPALILKDVITDCHGVPLHGGYEKWARELVNGSSAFMSMTGGEPFRGPVEGEPHSENDAITERYSIDFKFILGQSAQGEISRSARRLLVSDAATFSVLKEPKPRSKERLLIRLHVALRDYSLSQLWELYELGKGKNAKAKRRACPGDPSYDVMCFLGSFDRPKHLLLIYPVLFYADGGGDVSYDSINEGLYREYGSAIALRRELHPDMDTYVAYFSRGEFVITEAIDGSFRRLDEVPLSSSETFMEVAGYYDVFDYAQIGYLLVSGES